MLADRFTTRDVLKLTGVTARQLQWWDEKRVVVPERDGRNRIYSTADLVEILVKLLGMVKDRKVVPLLGRGRRDVQVALAFEDRSCYLAVDLAVKRKAAAAECEGGRIAF